MSVLRSRFRTLPDDLPRGRGTVRQREPRPAPCLSGPPSAWAPTIRLPLAQERVRQRLSLSGLDRSVHSPPSFAPSDYEVTAEVRELRSHVFRPDYL